jgi:hypothetical protein
MPLLKIQTGNDAFLGMHQFSEKLQTCAWVEEFIQIAVFS